MLRVSGKNATASEQVVYDDYIPLALDFGYTPSGVAAFWTTKPGGNILEIAVHIETGALLTVTCTSLMPEILVRKPFPASPNLVEVGLPVFEVTPWDLIKENPYVNEDVPVEVIVGDDEILISLLRDTSGVSKAIQNGNVSFGLGDAGELGNISVTNIAPSDMRKFLATCKREDLASSNQD
jgi:hypothetical protein